MLCYSWWLSACLPACCAAAAGWELGYNHYFGRLGMKMPQTRELLQTFAPEWWEMAWGLGTLAAADTAYQLWRPGLRALLTMTTAQCRS
jgi:hypothetical protein